MGDAQRSVDLTAGYTRNVGYQFFLLLFQPIIRRVSRLSRRVKRRPAERSLRAKE